MSELTRVATPGRLAAALAEMSHPRDFRQLRASAQGGGWSSFADVVGDEAGLSAAFRTALERYRGRDEVAGSLLSLRLAGPVIDVAVSLFVVKGWAVPLPADGVMLALNENGIATAVALRDPVILFETAAEHDEACGGSVGSAACAYLAEQLAAILHPGFMALKAYTRYGLRGMWGQAADQIAGIAARRARMQGLDQAASWQAAVELTDALARVQPLIRMRPWRFASSWPAGPATVPVKGSCCLYFKVSERQDEHVYCSNCPLLPDDARRPRVAALLQREYELLYRHEQVA